MQIVGMPAPEQARKQANKVLQIRHAHKRQENCDDTCKQECSKSSQLIVTFPTKKVMKKARKLHECFDQENNKQQANCNTSATGIIRNRVSKSQECLFLWRKEGKEETTQVRMQGKAGKLHKCMTLTKKNASKQAEITHAKK